MVERVAFVGLNNMMDSEASMIKKVSVAEFEKASRHVKDATLKLRVKTLNQEGNARVYEFTAQMDSPSAKFEVSNSGWNLSVVLHELFESMHNQAKKKLRMKE